MPLRTRFAPKIIAACALFYWAKASFGHENEAFGAIHWHATDTFVIVGVLAALAIAASRDRK
jgi:hypothetical protein